MIIGLRSVDFFLVADWSLEECSEDGVHPGLIARWAGWASIAKRPCKERERNA